MKIFFTVHVFSLILAGLFIIATIGVICALIALGIEYLYYKDRVPAHSGQARIPTQSGQARNTSSISSKKRRKELEIAQTNEATERSIF